MLAALRLQLPTAAMNPKCDGGGRANLNIQHLRSISPLKNNNRIRFVMSLSLQQQQSPPPDSSLYTDAAASVGSTLPSIRLSQSTLTQSHIHVLSFIACAAAVSATWLFCSAIPALLAFRKAAESLEKLIDVTQEELPDTMAAIRLSGMEISDLTTEISDLGQEITRGVRSSTRAVRLAEECLRRLSNITSSAHMQEVAPMDAKASGPALARNARIMREVIVKGRTVVGMFFTLIRFSRSFFNVFKSRAKA